MSLFPKKKVFKWTLVENVLVSESWFLMFVNQMWRLFCLLEGIFLLFVCFED